MEVLIAVGIVGLVAAFVLAPLREGPAAQPSRTADPALADLEARKQSKYREIRDTELDRAQGKLSESDFKRQEAELKGEAIEILKLIDARREALGEGEQDPDAATAEQRAGDLH